MSLPALLLALQPLAAPLPPPVAVEPWRTVEGSGLVAIRARRAESIANGTLEYAVILIEDGKIVTVGEDLPIERGIRVVELPDDWVVMPGLIDAYSRIGMDGTGSNGSNPHIRASAALFPRSKDYEKVLEAGVTTLAIYPAGNGAPGQAVVVRPRGATAEEMIVADNAYIKAVMRSNSGSKKILTKAWEDIEKYEEKVAKAREKWEKALEKQKKDDKKKKSDEEKAEAKKKERVPEKFVPPAADEDVEPWLQLLAGERTALFSINKSSDYLHLLDAIGDHEFTWHLRVPMTRELDLFYVIDDDAYPIGVEGIGDRGAYVVVEPSITLHPGTMRQRSLPAELAAAGAHVVFIPRQDNTAAVESWLRDTGELVAAGMDTQDALRALTLNPAEMLGLGDRLGSLEPGKDANLVFLNGNPFEPGTQVEAVMLEGEIVHGEVKP